MQISRSISALAATLVIALAGCGGGSTQRSLPDSGSQQSLGASPTSLSFTAQQGGSLPATQSVDVSSSTPVSFSAASSNSTWLAVTPASATSPARITASILTTNMSPATYNANVTLTSNAGNVNVPVTLTITASSSGGGGSGSNAYVLLAWSELGMHCMDGKDYSVFSVLPPYNTIYAKLLKKGSKPAAVSSGVTLTYVAMKDASGSINTTSYGNSTVAQKTNFWDYVQTLFLGQPLADVGLHNYPVQSLTPNPLKYDSAAAIWKAEGIPTAPYDDSGASKAYPLVQVVAKDSTGQVLATATVVPAVSDEMSCNNCHSPNTNANAMPAGGWVTQFTAAQNVKFNILKKHDDKHPISAAVLAAVQAKGYTYQASLYQTASNLNNPVLCAACHESNALNAAGMTTGVKDSAGNQLVPALTASMHSMHATVSLPNSSSTLDNATDPSQSCYQCHPGVSTKCQRGAMSGIACYNCHGNLSRVGQASRQGWLDVPNCQMCHQNGSAYTSTFTSTNIGPTGQQRATTDPRFATSTDAPATGLSMYRFSKGHGATECSGCHGSQHAEFPTSQPNDQLYSSHIQGYAGRVTECGACHDSTLATSATGGPHGMHTVGQSWVNAHHDSLSGGTSPCTACHGTDYRGSPRSKVLTARTFSVEGGSRSFAADHQMSCYDCHNGPNGG